MKNIAVLVVEEDKSEQVVFETFYEGTSHSTNVGRNGPVIVNSLGTSTISATKRVLFDLDGLRALPAAADVRTRTQITGLCATRFRCIVEKAARSRK